MKNIFHPRIVIWPIIVLCLHIIATLLGWYDYIVWLDTPMHFLGGASIALSAYYLAKDTGIDLPLTYFLLLLIGTSAFAAVLWEFMEFGGDYYFGSVMQPSQPDTMKDLFMGIIGAASAASIISWQTRNRR
jgi:hypothetical protein